MEGESGVCAEACNFDAISLDEHSESYGIDKEKCMGCGVCEDVCLVEAIQLRREPSRGDPLDLGELIAQQGCAPAGT